MGVQVAQDALEITTGARWAYGSGGGAYGVLRNAHYFVLIYYSQVLGLDPGLAGLAVGIGLVFDAITDPLIGYLSDSTRSRWGRRHPWLFASILPLATSFYFLWHPPGFIEGNSLLFVWLVVCNVCMRTALTMFAVPALAIVAELTSDYDQRTRLLTLFHVVYSTFNNVMSVLMYAIWLVPTDEYVDGVMNQAGYQEAGLVGTVIIVISVLAFSIGLRRFIPRLSRYRIDAPLSPGQFFRQVADVFRSASARIVVLGGVLYYAGVGTYVALWVYIYSYFWEFTSEQIAIISIPMALAALFLPPAIARWGVGREKKNVAITGLLSGMAINVIPITLRLLGFFPENGSSTLFYIMLVAGFFETMLLLLFDISWRSMIADLTERTELETGRRNEGVISSTITFTSKCADGLGTLIAGTVLTLISFPTGTGVGEVSSDVIAKLGLVYGPMIFLIWMGVIVTISRYRISRSRHEEMLERLSNR
ncbi:MAG: MFS transporter [Woeseiaceae bacterium]|nr:MFS transporter [Woeseiaceae bacterium]